MVGSVHEGDPVRGGGRVRIVPASLEDLKAIDDLRRKDQESVGFIPMSRYEAEVERGRDTLLSAFENDDLVGFLFWTRGFPVATIQQVVIREDARRVERATALVSTALTEMKRQGRVGVTCRSRLNIPGIELWRALGWRELRREQSGRRGDLARFYYEISPALFDLAPYLRAPGYLPGQRQGFRRRRTA